MARKDIRNAIVDELLSKTGLPVTRNVVNELIKKGGSPDDLQSLYDLRGMLLRAELEAKPIG